MPGFAIKGRRNDSIFTLYYYYCIRTLLSSSPALQETDETTTRVLHPNPSTVIVGSSDFVEIKEARLTSAWISYASGCIGAVFQSKLNCRQNHSCVREANLIYANHQSD